MVNTIIIIQSEKLPVINERNEDKIYLLSKLSTLNILTTNYYKTERRT
jgi:hypothetical protein